MAANQMNNRPKSGVKKQKWQPFIDSLAMFTTDFMNDERKQPLLQDRRYSVSSAKSASRASGLKPAT